jgi:ABC-2 type transport system permease protein
MSGQALKSLFMVQLLAGLNVNALLVRRKRLKAWLATLGMIALMTPSYIGIVIMQVKAFAYLQANALPLEDMLLIGVYSAALLMILFAGIPTVYAALYQSNELSILLPLPYRPWQIVAAKLAMIYVVELIVGWAFFLPSLIAYYAYGYASLASVPVAIVGLLLMPIVPLALSAIACILIANVPGIGRSRWFWFVGITMALLAASLLLTAGMMTDSPEAMTDLVEVRMRQIAQIGRMMPGVQFAMYALVDDRWTALLHQGSNLVVACAYVLAVLSLGSALYIGPILRGDSVATGSVAVRRRGAARAGSAETRSFLLSCVRKEWICVLKDPAVAMNGLGGYIALPLLAVTYTIMKVQTKGKVDVIGQMDRLLHSPEFVRHLPFFVIGIALGLATFGSLSSLFSASYSKDGKRLWLERSLPVAPFSIYMGKLLAGYSLVSALNLVTIGIASLAVPFRAQHWLYVVLLSQVAIAWNAAVGLAIDCVRPKLVWKDTVQAVKQNMNVVLAMGVSFAGIGINAVLLKALWEAEASPSIVYAAAFALNVALLAGALFLGRAASVRFDRLHV